MNSAYKRIIRLKKHAPVFLSVIIFLLSFSGCSSLEHDYVSKVQNEFKKQPLMKEKILCESDITHLPTPVKKYIRYTGAIGKAKPQNMYIAFNAKMIKKTGADPMESSSEQYNFFSNPSRLFFMKSSMMMMPIQVLHIYTNQCATFRVRIASIFNAVDLSGENLSSTETVTVLNDMCVFAPGCLIDTRLSWKSIDSLSSKVTFINGPYTVSALLIFSDNGELVNFISEDRSALQDDGTLRRAEWSTPIRDYKEFNGRKIPTYGETIWHYPEGDFIYGKFTLKEITYNVK